MRITVLLESPAILADQSQPTMLAPDYQEFANWLRRAIRDNTVICTVIRSLSVKKPPDVARLPRQEPGTKAELLPGPEKGTLSGPFACKQLFKQTLTPASATRLAGVSAAPLKFLHQILVRNSRLPPQLAFARAAGSSGRLSITLSTRPNALASSAVRNLSRSSASSIALKVWPVCLT